MKKTFVTNIPDKSGAFLVASQIIAQNNGNIVRVNYNKALDETMLFVDVEATEVALKQIDKELKLVGYVNSKIKEKKFILIEIKIPDKPGAVVPILLILQKFNVNISYMDSIATGESSQNFKMGLVIENSEDVKKLIDEISAVYAVNILEYDMNEDVLDNTVFYINFANEMRELFDLSDENVINLIAESNRISQRLNNKGENNLEIFEKIRRYAHFIKNNKGENYNATVERVALSEKVELLVIEPVCGSNSYIFKTADEYVLIDTGYAVFFNEFMTLVLSMLPDFKEKLKRIYITHADQDHVGLLNKFDNVDIFVNKTSLEFIRRQNNNEPDFREMHPNGYGYSGLTKIITNYKSIKADKLKLLSDLENNSNKLIEIAQIQIGDIPIKVFEGNGGHVKGEMIFLADNFIVSGDCLINIKGFKKEQAEFNALAPFLMESVNIDSKKASLEREEILNFGENKKEPFYVFGGHGQICVLKGRKLCLIEK